MSTFNSPADQTELSLAQASSVNTLDAAIAAAFALLPTNANIDDGTVNFAVDTGAADAYLVALPQTATAYNDGLLVVMRPLNNNTGASTINVDSLGVKAIRRQDSAALEADDIIAGVPIAMRYSTSTGFFHIGPNALAAATAAAASQVAAADSAAAAAVSAAAAAASAAIFPTISGGDAGKRLQVNATEDGYVFKDPYTLESTLNAADQTIQRANFKDCGVITNALGDLGGGTDDIDLEDGNVVSATVSTGAQTFTFSNPTASDEECGFVLYLTNGGSQTVNWPASVDWEDGSAPSLTASGVDVLVFTTIDGGTIWNGFVATLDMK